MMTDDEMAARLFDNPNVHGDAARAIERNALDNLATRHEAAAQAEGMAEHFRAIGLTSTEASRLADLRGNPTPEQRQVWREDATKALRQDYGDAAGDVLKDVRAYIAQHPKLRDHLRNTGLGDHPQWVRTVAEKAREARKAGKLR